MSVGNQSVCLTFTSKEKYCRIFNDLLDHEILTINTENELEPSYLFNLKFIKVGDSDYIAEIANSSQFNQNFLFYKKQLLSITKANNEEKGFIGRVINKENNIITIACIQLEKQFADGPYKIKNKQTTDSYERMKRGLEKFKSKKISYMNKDIEALILGVFPEKFTNKNEYIKASEIPNKLNILELGHLRLNKSQEKAIVNCFNYKLTLIKGPPGTGKSTVLSILTYHLIKLKKINHKILICAPSNRAVDNISFLLQKIDSIKFVRVLSPEKELSDDIDKTNCLYKLSKEVINKNPEKNKRIKQLIEKRENNCYLKKSDKIEYRKLMENIENNIINSCDIVLSTINNSADQRLDNYFFPIVIIDEASQSLEPDTLLPLLHNAEMAVLIGDDKQLGPTVISKECDIAGLNISLFERLCYYYQDSNFISLLNEQYRMPESLYRFSNQFFYNNKVITKTVNHDDINVMSNFDWPDKSIPSVFYHYTEPEEESENKSYFNETEINLIFKNVKKLINSGVESNNIGIITPYNAQKISLEEKKMTKNKIYENLRIESVDGFQGMEKDYIFISCVRSNLEGNIGFLSSKKRLNVALTRARKGLIIFGNCKTLSKRSDIWRNLIDFYASKKLIIDKNNYYVEKEDIISKKKYFDEDDGKEEEKRERKYNKIIKMNNEPAPLIKKNNIDKINDYIDNQIILNKIKNENNINNENRNNMIQKRKPQYEKEKAKGNKKYQNKLRSQQNKDLKNKEEDKKENDKDENKNNHENKNKNKNEKKSKNSKIKREEKKNDSNNKKSEKSKNIKKDKKRGH